MTEGDGQWTIWGLVFRKGEHIMCNEFMQGEIMGMVGSQQKQIRQSLPDFPSGVESYQ